MTAAAPHDIPATAFGVTTPRRVSARWARAVAGMLHRLAGSFGQALREPAPSRWT